VLMVASIFIGTHILGFFGISLPVVQVGGGLVVVVSTGWALLRHSDDEDATKDAKSPCNEANYMRQAFYPLTLPLTVGPGSIAVAITVGANRTEGAEWRWPLIAGLLIGALVIAVSIYLLRFAEYSDKSCGAGFSLRGTSVPLERLAGTCGRRAEATPQAEACPTWLVTVFCEPH